MFEEIKGAVSTKEAASFYGLNVGRGGMVCCPFHNDKHPSMKMDQGFYCFGCGAHGDVISFVQRMFSLDAKEAAFKLVDDFHLNIDTKRKESKHERDARIRQAKQKEYEDKVRRAYLQELNSFRLKLADIHRTFLDWELKYAPGREEWEADRIDERYATAIRNKENIGYILDILDYGKEDERYEAYKHRKETIEVYERRITEAEHNTADGNRGRTAPRRDSERIP